MDHSQHSIPSHGPIDHSMHHHPTDTPTMVHDHDAMMAAAITTTMNPNEAMLGVNHNMHATHYHTGGTGTGMEHMMSMAFHFGYNETILFSWWHIDSIMGLFGSMIAIFLLALFYEGLKYYREYLFWKTYNLLEYRPVTGPQSNPEAARTQPAATTSTTPVQPSMLSLNHIIQTLLHILQVTLSFLLMLIFMTYNVWLCMTVVLGAAVGYFLFCWKKSVIVDVTEHCH